MAKSATPAPERQQFIPVSREKVKQALLGKWQLDEDSSQKYSNLFKMFEVIWHHDMHHDLEDLKKGYDSMNPDSFEDINYNQTNLSSFLEKLDEVMMDGNWLTITDEEIDEAIEEWLLRTFGHDIDFEVDDALAKLEKMNLLSVADDGKLSVVSVENALVTLDDYWDNLYDFVE